MQPFPSKWHSGVPKNYTDIERHSASTLGLKSQGIMNLLVLGRLPAQYSSRMDRLIHPPDPAASHVRGVSGPHAAVVLGKQGAQVCACVCLDVEMLPPSRLSSLR